MLALRLGLYLFPFLFAFAERCYGRSAIGATRDAALLKRTFDFSLSGARDQDVPSVFAGLSANKKSRRELAKFFRDNYATVCLSVFLIVSALELTIKLCSSTRDSERTQFCDTSSKAQLSH